MSDDVEYTVDTPSEQLWSAIDDLREKRDKLMTISRAEEMGFNQRLDMYKRQVTNPAMKNNAEAQIRLMQQQRTFAEQNLRRNTQKIDTQIDTINRLLEEKKVRDQRELEVGLTEVKTDVSNLKLVTSELTGQINALRAEAQARKKEFDASIAEIRQQATASSEWSEDVYAQIYTLQAQAQVLMAEYDAKQKALREKQYIDENPSYSRVYSTVFSKMNEIFIASKAIASGMVTREAYSDGEKLASYMTLLNEKIPFPPAQMVMTCITNRVEGISAKREEDRINNISSNASSFSEMDEICDWIARGLVFAFEEQIQAMTAKGVETFSECLVRGVIEFLSTPPAERDAGLPHHSSVDNPLDPAALLVSQVLVFLCRKDYQKVENGVEKVASGCFSFLEFSFLASFAQRSSTAATLERSKNPVAIETRIPNVEWTDVGIFQLSGLRTATGTTWYGDDSRPDLYGYRLGGVRDAFQLHYIEYPTRATSKVLPLTEDQLDRNPEAHRKVWEGR
ncbi:hypothetical protein H310_08923 [Aphanomyces invadans]|uniref:Uncharacterized protein n=1 Tax=Aphanomyces invadans TaxID=157072 RepID=A0A024TXW3_9STRA|nr:hypothetical protein H310_08923 [Aphanomyces invadans]ETV98197.1 hypothetical protein H310_08923 [Aphanomyces invadans]|eukprot:XP_008873072.1 hypothetical protein H310_08923 [Aphanomyces invadans]